MDRESRPAAVAVDRAHERPHERAVECVPKPRFDRDALRAALLERLPEFVRAQTAPDTPIRETGGDIRVGRRGSLSVRLDSGVWFDHEAGAGGDVFELACALTGARDFPDTLRRIADFTATRAAVPGSITPVRPCSCAKLKAADTRAVARQVWNATRPIGATLAAAYLDARGVGHVASAAALRFHPGLSHPNGPGGFPALVAGVQDASGRFLGIQRTYLHGPHKAAVEPVRASLGSIAGGAVRLCEPHGGALLLGEGIESTAAAVLVLNWKDGAWATLGTSGLLRVVLPEHVQSVVIAADRDAGGLRAAAALAERLEGDGRSVEIRVPSRGDFTDQLGEAMP